MMQDGARWCKMVQDGARWFKMVQAYMQKMCDVAKKDILAEKKFAEKVRKSRQNVNRDKSA